MNKSFSFMWSDELGEAIKAASVKPYPMELIPADFELVRAAINQGIDSHLEAVSFEQFNANHHHGFLKHGVVIEPHTLHTLVRRLMESGNEEAEQLASSICTTLDIELI